jgi:hypothetical protein
MLELYSPNCDFLLAFLCSFIEAIMRALNLSLDKLSLWCQRGPDAGDDFTAGRGVLAHQCVPEIPVRED